MERYGLFGAICFVYAVAVVWLLFRRRVTLQSSLTFLMVLLLLGGSFILLQMAPALVAILGFTLPANLFFSAAIGTLAFLHLTSLMAMSRLEQRSITLVQEVALLQEQVSQLASGRLGFPVESKPLDLGAEASSGGPRA